MKKKKRALFVTDEHIQVTAEGGIMTLLYTLLAMTIFGKTAFSIACGSDEYAAGRTLQHL